MIKLLPHKSSEWSSLVSGPKAKSSFTIGHQFYPLDEDLIRTMLNACGLTELISPAVQLSKKSILEHDDQVCLYLIENIPSRPSCFSILRRPWLCLEGSFSLAMLFPSATTSAFLSPVQGLWSLCLRSDQWGGSYCTPDVCVMAQCSAKWSVDYLGPVFNSCLLPP